MIEEVESLHPKGKLEMLLEIKETLKSQIDLVGRKTAENVSSRVSLSTRGGCAEGSWVNASSTGNQRVR